MIATDIYMYHKLFMIGVTGMCGFAGYITTDGKGSEYKEDLIEMMNSIKHRGPDDEGTHIDDMAGSRF